MSLPKNLFGEHPLMVLSDGLGVDSNAFKVLLYKDRRFEKYVPDYIVHVNTGAEMPYTHKLVEPEIRAWMVNQGYPSDKIIIIDHNSTVYSPPSKVGAIDEWYGRQPKAGIPTRNKGDCTDGAKISKFNRWLNSIMPLSRGRWKQFGQRHQVIIGIAADEAHRIGEEPIIRRVNPGRDYIEYVYPLVEFGITRQDCFDILAEEKLPAIKSGCFCCPFQPIRKYWAVRELYPSCHARSVEMERKAMAHNPKLALVGDPGQTLNEVIDAWVEKQEGLPDPWQTLVDDYALDRCW